MIHAYLFVTNNHFDHDDHGNEFQKHMKRINQQGIFKRWIKWRIGKASITIYHTFHDEVESCRKWWWRCDGPCRNKPPYYGYVKRAMNRPPQKADWWFDKHQVVICILIYLIRKNVVEHIILSNHHLPKWINI